jgi:hypothetical protein
MTDFTNFRDRNRDQQDGIERGAWGTLTHVNGSGSHMSVRGTGTLDEEVPVLNTGYGFNLPADSDAEVIMLAAGSDVNAKLAIVTLPRDKQHQWPEGTGGVQHPLDPSRRIEFNSNEMHLKDGTFVLGHSRAVTVTIIGDNVSLSFNGDIDLSTSGKLVLSASDVEINGATLTHNGKNIGDDHKHGGVDTGGGISGEPV